MRSEWRQNTSGEDCVEVIRETNPQVRDAKKGERTPNVGSYKVAEYHI